MGNFNGSKYWDMGSYEKSINAARQDLEADHPGAWIFVYWSEWVAGGLEVKDASTGHGWIHQHDFDLKNLSWGLSKSTIIAPECFRAI
ncbi:MAG: hypothetical protein MMC33_005883 [Icmadophila ericetorum]|nr:hypothetical protein [Icmadophila ericetorum]